jgi:predicted DNA-binding ribbon-helix-helix protein
MIETKTPLDAARAAARPVKRSFSLSGHRTSISLEAAFWDALKEAAAAEGQSMTAVVGQIDKARGDAGLSGAVRVWVLEYYKRQAAGEPQPQVVVTGS